MIIFESPNGVENRGRVAVLENDGAAGSLLSVDDWGGFEAMKSIFTKVSMQEATNHQFLHTLGDRIYLYVFGDRIGNLSLSGVSFHDICNDDRQLGISKVVDYYRRNRLAVREKPLKVTIDPGTTFECYLQGVQAETVNAADRMYQFNLLFALLPEEGQDGCLSGGSYIGDANPPKIPTV